MKATKRLFILLALAAVSLLSACNKYEGVEMYQRQFVIKSSDWKAEPAQVGLEDAYLLSVKLSVPEITSKVVQYGNVTVSRQLKDDNGNTFWTPLPAVRAEYSYEEGEGGEGNKEIFYSTYLDYEWGEGTVFVYFTATDFVIGEEPEMILRVTAWI